MSALINSADTSRPEPPVADHAMLSEVAFAGRRCSMGWNDSPGFTVRTEARNGVAWLALVGELDIAVAPTLEDELLRVENDGVDSALLDLGELTFMDCSGLHVLLRATHRANENGHRLAIVGVGGLPRRLLELTGTEGVLIDDTAALPMINRFSQGAGEEDTSSAVIGDDLG